jgi:SAM-dependent methyltransferase
VARIDELTDGARLTARAARVHEQRDLAEAFGTDAARYDRSRPGYPATLIDRIVAGSPGPAVLDVGCGTGIASRLFQLAGGRVLGLDPDPRMAAVAAASGIDVEVATFEDWDPVGRRFDALVAAQAWHWTHPVAGAAKAAAVLRAGGRIALFWNAAQLPAGLREAFADVYTRVLPGTPVAEHYRSSSTAEAYIAFLDSAADGLAKTGAFGEPDRWRDDWDHTYTRDEWLDQVPSHGGFSAMSPELQDRLLAGLSAAIDGVGGAFTVAYATVTISAARR